MGRSTKTFFEEAFQWLRKEFSPLSSSLPVSLLQQANVMARQRSTLHQPSTQLQSTHHQRSILKPSTHQLRSTLHQQSTLQPSTLHQKITLHQRSTPQPSTHRQHLIMEDISSHFVNASTPSMGNPTHTGETRTPCVGPRDLGSATSTATLTVAISSILPAHQGASLLWLVTSSRAQNGSNLEN